MSAHLEKLIDIALARIERNRGIRGLTLRAIARDAGSSHVNLYHYVSGLDELAWRCYCRAMDLYKLECSRAMDAPGGEDLLLKYARGAMGFARGRPGLYRLLWLDDLSSPPPDFALELILRVSGEFRALSSASLGGGPEGSLRAGIFGDWLVGRLSLAVGGRFLEGRSEEEARLLADAAALLVILRDGKSPYPIDGPSPAGKGKENYA